MTRRSSVEWISLLDDEDASATSPAATHHQPLTMAAPAPHGAAQAGVNDGDAVHQGNASDVDTYIEHFIVPYCQREGVTLWRNCHKPSVDQVNDANKSGRGFAKFTKASLRAHPMLHWPSMATDIWVAALWGQDDEWYLFMARRDEIWESWGSADFRIYTTVPTPTSDIINSLSTLFMFRIAQASLQPIRAENEPYPQSPRGAKRKRIDDGTPTESDAGEFELEETISVLLDEDTNCESIHYYRYKPEKKRKQSESGPVLCEMFRQFVEAPLDFWFDSEYRTGLDGNGYPDSSLACEVFHKFLELYNEVKTVEKLLQARLDEACSLLVQGLKAHNPSPEQVEALLDNYEEVMASRRRKAEDDEDRKRNGELEDSRKCLRMASAWLKVLPRDG